MALSEYDRQFAEAMALKRKLSRQQGSKTTEQSVAASEPLETSAAPMRDGIMDQILAERPGLTREKLSRQMAEMGF